MRDYDPEIDGGYALLIDRVLADDVLGPEAAAGLVAGNRHVQ